MCNPSLGKKESSKKVCNNFLNTLYKNTEPDYNIKVRFRILHVEVLLWMICDSL